MKQWLKKATACLCAGLMLAAPGKTANAGENQAETYNITFRIQGEGTVKLKNADYGETVFDEGERTFSLTPGSYVSVTARTEDSEKESEDAGKQKISMAVTTPDGIELEPVSSWETDVFTREITVTEIDKVVDIRFGNSRDVRNKVMRAAAEPSEAFPNGEISLRELVR